LSEGGAQRPGIFIISRTAKPSSDFCALLQVNRNTVIAAARLTFTLIAYNVAQIAKSKVADRLKARGIRTLRQELNRQFGFRSSPIMVFAAGAFTILPLEELVLLLGGKPPQFLFSRQGSYA
jgi:hypothetical protein